MFVISKLKLKRQVVADLTSCKLRIWSFAEYLSVSVDEIQVKGFALDHQYMSSAPN